MTTRLHNLSIANRQFFSEVEDMLAEERNVTIPTKGRSMFPFIVGERDIVEIEPVTERSGTIRKGDVVLARLADGMIVLHRVYEMSDSGKLTLMGDRNLYKVEECLLGNILGRVCRICRKGKWIDCGSRLEMMKGRLWMFLKPCRRGILGVWKRMAGVKITTDNIDK